MRPDIQITVEQGIVRVVHHGEQQFDVTNEALREVARVASENQTNLLLFDIRQATDENFHVNTIRHTEQAPALGLTTKFRVAVLSAPDDPRLRYIENVAVNRGFDAKSFTDDAEAVAWLHGAEKQS